MYLVGNLKELLKKYYCIDIRIVFASFQTKYILG